MSWILKLYDTYEQNSKSIGDSKDKTPLLPLYHTVQNAHVQVVINSNGEFLRASVVLKNDAQTIIPCTESSGGRTGVKPECHPLCDNLQFLAGDICRYGGTVTSGYSNKPNDPYEMFIKKLNEWCESKYKHDKAASVLKYVRKARLVEDLISYGVLHVDGNEKLLKMTKEQLKRYYKSEEKIPEIFKVIQPDQKDKTVDQSSAFVRWCIEVPGNPQAEAWSDSSLWESWANYLSESESEMGICYVLGKEVRIAKQHPKRIRRGNDGAKLISSNDKSGFTFRGRFTDDDGTQACGVSTDITQKAHSALRWLIGRQSFMNGDQVIVSWSVAGKQIPDPFANSADLFESDLDSKQDTLYSVSASDAGQSFALRLKKFISGYQTKLGSTEDIVVMGIDSASPGRMAIIFYRVLTGSDFLERVEAWHKRYAWHQNYSSTFKFTGAPAPKEIAEAAYGRRLDGKQGDKLRKSIIERLLPCIIDGRQIPYDLVQSSVISACKRIGMKRVKFGGKEFEEEWERVLGIACALFRGYNEERSYAMALEPDRKTRDYLYGRLLAIAEHIESWALYVAGEKRDTNAAKLMQRFADRPFSTWKTIELSLIPYKTRLQSKRPGFLFKMKELLDIVHSLFSEGDYENDQHLSGEFLLGYHCQRQKLNEKTEVEEKENNDTILLEGE